MDTERFNQIQHEISAILEELKVCSDPVERHDLLLALRLLIAEIERLSADSINKLQGNKP
jgi:hypothetical protein